MYNNADQFRFYDEKVKKEEKELESFPSKPEDYNMPMIYLTEDEIKEFNEICEKENLDLKVCPLSQFTNREQLDDETIAKEIKLMAQTFKGKNKEVKEPEPENKKGENKNKVNLDYKIKYVNEYIGKKQMKKTPDQQDDKEDEKNSEHEKNSDSSSDSSKSDEIYKNEDGKYVQNKKKDIKRNINKGKNKKRKIIEDEEEEKVEKLNLKKKKPEKLNDNFFKYFEKIKTSSQQTQNEEKRTQELISEILEKSQYLTEEGLAELSKQKHIRILGRQLSISDLHQKKPAQLEDILVNIEYNSRFIKLEPNRGVNIRNIINKEELEKRNYEKAEQKRRLKEEIMKNKYNKDNEQNNGEKKMSEEDQSESSYDEDDKSLD